MTSDVGSRGHTTVHMSFRRHHRSCSNERSRCGTNLAISDEERHQLRRVNRPGYVSTYSIGEAPFPGACRSGANWPVSTSLSRTLRSASTGTKFVTLIESVQISAVASLACCSRTRSFTKLPKSRFASAATRSDIKTLAGACSFASGRVMLTSPVRRTTSNSPFLVAAASI